MGSGQNDDVAAGSSQHDQSNANVPEPPMQSHSQQEDKVDNMETDIEVNTAKRMGQHKISEVQLCIDLNHMILNSRLIPSHCPSLSLMMHLQHTVCNIAT